jgi:hypothetical protein
MANPPLFAMMNHIRGKKGIPTRESGSMQISISAEAMRFAVLELTVIPPTAGILKNATT